MKKIEGRVLEKLYRPKKDSHKGQNGKLLVIGGSELFHSASLWALEVASRMVDMVFYSSVPVNEEIVKKQKERFHDGIVVPEGKLDEYIKEADCVLIGPGMARHSPGKQVKVKDLRAFALKELIDEGETEVVVNYLLKKYPKKKWVVDGGALQMMDKSLISQSMILTPHKKEYERLFGESHSRSVIEVAKKYDCTIVLKGEEDIICDSKECVVNTTGNEGMTKGGTGDVLAGLVAGLYCNNEAFLAASAGVYINGLAGDRLYKKVGSYFNASDLMNEIPKVMALHSQGKTS